MIKIAIAFTAALAFGTASAHGDAPAKHGGIVKVSNDITFELVVKEQENAADLYLEDHGEGLPTAGMRGKLTVLKGAEKAEVELQPAGGNKFSAKGVKIAPGSRVVAAVASADGQVTLTTRFSIQ